MDIISLVVSLISGAIGGNVAGAALKEQSLGTVGNSIAGILGGGIGGAILQAMGVAAPAGGGLDIGSLVGQFLGGGVGGGILMVVIALIRGAIGKPRFSRAQLSVFGSKKQRGARCR